MVYLNGNKIYRAKIASSITPTSVETYPTNLVYGTHYRSGNHNDQGKGFTVEGMSEYIDSPDSEEFFFALMSGVDLTEDEPGIGFTIDLGETQMVGIMQLYMMNIWTTTILHIYASKDGLTYSSEPKAEINCQTTGAMYSININEKVKCIRIVQSKAQYGGWSYRLDVKGVKIFAPMHNATLKILTKETQQ